MYKKLLGATLVVAAIIGAYFALVREGGVPVAESFSRAGYRIDTEASNRQIVLRSTQDRSMIVLPDALTSRFNFFGGLRTVGDGGAYEQLNGGLIPVNPLNADEIVFVASAYRCPVGSSAMAENCQVADRLYTYNTKSQELVLVATLGTSRALGEDTSRNRQIKTTRGTELYLGMIGHYPPDPCENIWQPALTKVFDLAQPERGAVDATFSPEIIAHGEAEQQRCNNSLWEW